MHGAEEDERSFRPVFLGNPFHRDVLVLDAVPPDSRVLDVGCADGRLGEILEQRGCRVTGVELTPALANRARTRLSEVHCGPIEGLLREGHLVGPYDAIVCADVLEHLVDPWHVLGLLAATLAPNGVVVLSIPNVAFICTRITVALGRMEYSGAGGAFDLGHLRFFTLATARDLVESAGLRIRRERPIPWVLRGERLDRIRGLRIIAGLINGPPQDFAARLYPRLLSVGTVFVAGLSEACPSPTRRTDRARK